MTNDIRVILRDMPMSVKGFTVLKDGYFTIVINANLSREAQERTYRHEMSHIQSGDFEKECADMIELQSHKGA